MHAAETSCKGIENNRILLYLCPENGPAAAGNCSLNNEMKILILNGPNLNLQGRRNLAVYGVGTLDDLAGRLAERYPDVEFVHFQSNVEGELIDALQRAAQTCDGVVLNAGGYTHTSVALRDAVEAIPVPVVEVHISSILAREEFRHVSLLASVVAGSVMGFGLDSYLLGVESLRLRSERQSVNN